MREDRWCNHAEADLEEALVRNLVLALEPRVDALEGSGETTSAVLFRATDPTKPGIEFLASPGLRLFEHDEFLLACALFEHVDLVGTLAPDKGLLRFLTLEIGIEKCRCGRCEILG